MVALGFFLLLLLCLRETSGHFLERYVLALTVGQVVYSVTLLLRPPAPLQGRGRDLRVAGLFSLCALLLLRQTNLLYAAPGPALRLIQGGLAVLLALSLLALGLWLRGGRGRALLGTLVAALVLLVGVRLLVLRASPAPLIDVFTSCLRGVEYLRGGHNPYSGAYQDIYQGRYDYPPGFAYWPGYLLWATLWDALVPFVHDVRLSLVLAEVGVALCLHRLLRGRGVAPASALGAVALWLCSPVALFIVEQAWIDALSLLGFCAAALLLSEGRTTGAGALLGLTLSTKQPAFVGVAFFLIHIARSAPRAALLRAGLACAAAFTAVMAPFVLWSPRGFTRSTLTVAANLLPRTDSLNLMALLARAVGPRGDDALRALYGPAGVLGGALWLLLLLHALRRRQGCSLRDALALTSVAYGLLFMLAKQAFCNYYYFLSLFVFATALLPEALGGRAPPAPGTGPGAAPAPPPSPAASATAPAARGCP